jgi:hypothetical protein
MSVVETVVETTVVPVTRRDVLHRAADLLEEFGWCQHDYGSYRRGAFCAVGAIAHAARDLGDPVPADSKRCTFIGQYEDKYQDIIEADDGLLHYWNDAPGRTKAEVVARLREAAERT